jgi:hypothetical protein
MAVGRMNVAWRGSLITSLGDQIGEKTSQVDAAICCWLITASQA